MTLLICGAVWLGLVVYLLSRALRQAAAYRAAVLPQRSAPDPTASVSIIVPVRNERDNVANCISGLIEQTGLAPGSSITIVDDESEDGSAAIIRQHIKGAPSMRMTSAGALPQGWVGKTHACWIGAMAASSAWVCFIDADLDIDAGLVAAALGAATARKIDMLTLHPSLLLSRFWERLLIPAGLLLLACAKPLHGAARLSPVAEEANGQFLLIRREVYFAVGGHAAVASEISEDKALAGRVLDAGFCFRSLVAEHLAKARMYRDFRSLWQGLGKNALEVLDGVAKTLTTAIVGMFVGWGALLVPIALEIGAFASPSAASMLGLGLAGGGASLVLAVQLLTARHFRIPLAYGLIMPFGYMMAAVLVAHSLFLRVNGGVAWKGRRYDLRRNPSQARL